MGILVTGETTVVIQGITGHVGQRTAQDLLKAGTRVIGGIAPGRGGKTIAGVPVYDSMSDLAAREIPSASLVLVPGRSAFSAAREAIASGVSLVVVIPEMVPLRDVTDLLAFAAVHSARVLGPSTYGLIAPGTCKLGLMPDYAFLPGRVGIVSRSGTLATEVASHLTEAGIGQSTSICIGGGILTGTSYLELVEAFDADSETSAIVLVGEVGGTGENEVARWRTENPGKPIVAYLVGQHAPAGQSFGHAGSIVEGEGTTYLAKAAAFGDAGIRVATSPWDVVRIMSTVLSEQA